MVTEEEREELISLTRRHRTAQAIALRARIVLSCSAGLDNKAVAAILNVRASSVGNEGTGTRETCAYFSQPACRVMLG